MHRCWHWLRRHWRKFTGGTLYCFRVPFSMPDRSLLGLTATRFDLVDEQGLSVWLASTEVGQPLNEATSLVIRGQGYLNEMDASVDGDRWREVLSRALARLHLGADFGDRRPFGAYTAAGLASLSAQAGGSPVVNDVPGVSTFEHHPDTRFVRSEAHGCRRPSEAQNAEAIRTAVILNARLSPVERLAFDLFSGSFFQPSADARLLMLTMAVETLLDLQPRSEAARAHVEYLIGSTSANQDLTKAERQSLAGSLEWLRAESIGQSGRRLARSLEPRRYMDLPPARFFTRCYDMRSALVHGHVPRPDRDAVDLVAANLEVFVGHLLSGPLLEAVPD